MGLSISTGMLADLHIHDPEGAEWLAEDFEKLNVLLEQQGLPKHLEPITITKPPSRGQHSSFPYGYLHRLRRALAFANQDPSAFGPIPDGMDAANDPILENELYVMMNSHLICHSDCEGFYLPIDFAEPLIDDLELNFAGAIVGSSQRLQQELIKVAPLLEIQLDSGILSDAEAQKLARHNQQHPFEIERLVWFALYEATVTSLAQKTAIVFT